QRVFFECDHGRPYYNLLNANRRLARWVEQVAPRDNSDKLVLRIENGEALVRRSARASREPSANVAQRLVAPHGRDITRRCVSHEHALEIVCGILRRDMRSTTREL